MPELLAPAGTPEKLKTALAFGADAVYFGVPNFSLRSRINDFNEKNIAENINYVHRQGKQAYLTFNIFPHSRHLKALTKATKLINEVKPDAVIVSDPGVINYLKTELVDIPLHLSTQANCTNWRAAEFWYQQGIERVILAREATLEDVKEIHQRVPKLELECFVHGAMCMSYSGRCILSKWMTGRSANLGDCAQPCRWQYQMIEKLRPNEPIPIEEDQHGTYIMNSKDLCLLRYLNELEEAGICSFKIEGRTKSIYYVANIIKIYRQAIDGKRSMEQLEKELAKITNRGYTSGFLFGEEKCEHNFTDSHQIADWQFVGEILDYDKKSGLAKMRVHNAIHQGDQLEFVIPGDDNFTQELVVIQEEKTGKQLEEAHGGGGSEAVLIKVDKLVAPLTVVRRKIK